MKKTLYSIYAVVAYAVGMASIAFLMGFMIDLPVPKSINAGPSAPLPSTIPVNIAILVAFLVPHSVMARPWFKSWWTRIVPPLLERATYILISGVTVLAMIWAWQPMPGTLWQVEHPALKTALYGCYASGWLMITLATFNIDHFSFFGLRQVWDHVLGRTARKVPFSARFLYGVVRHPISLGWIILFWSTPHMTVGHLLFASCMSLYIAIVTPIEEADLVAALGDDYRRYKARVRGFIPWPRKADSRFAVGSEKLPDSPRH